MTSVSEPIYFRDGQRYGPPRSGPGGTLAGYAEPGARLEVCGIPDGGSFINRGSKAEPRWERLYPNVSGSVLSRHRRP